MHKAGLCTQLKQRSYACVGFTFPGLGNQEAEDAETGPDRDESNSGREEHRPYSAGGDSVQSKLFNIMLCQLNIERFLFNFKNPKEQCAK